MPKNTQINKGVIVQQDQNNAFPSFIPNYSIPFKFLQPGTRKGLMDADAVVGNADDVNNGKADFTSVQSAINTIGSLGGGKILVLNGTYSEDLSIPSNVTLFGRGHLTVIAGTITFSGNYSLVKYLKSNSVIFSASTDGNRITDTWVSSSSTVTNNGLGGNHWDISGE